MATGAANQAKVLGALAASFPIAYVMWQTQVHVLGHPVPVSAHKDWEAKTALMNLSKEMEGDPERPVLLNPFRTGVPATVRNKDDLPGIESTDDDE
mmetsp:Transcript_14571/g.44048  ORF Transcript_14571/g.44048 Transcript_14571/m.44048 type:complete len:96 (-) Transcript_14571:2245-2532(-)